MSLKIVRCDVDELNVQTVIEVKDYEVLQDRESLCDAEVLQNRENTRYAEALQNREILKDREDILDYKALQDENDILENKVRVWFRSRLLQSKDNAVSSLAFFFESEEIGEITKENVLRVAVEESNAILQFCEMDIYLVIPDNVNRSTDGRIFWNMEAELEDYIDQNYDGLDRETDGSLLTRRNIAGKRPEEFFTRKNTSVGNVKCSKRSGASVGFDREGNICESVADSYEQECEKFEASHEDMADLPFWLDDEQQVDELNRKLEERVAHRADTFSEYFLFLIESKGLKNADVYHKAMVDKRYFSKIKNNRDFHPEKIKALCLCVGARLNLDETKDLLARAGYALSPSDLTDIIFTFFIEQEHYDVIDIDIKLEEYGLPCVIS